MGVVQSKFPPAQDPPPPPGDLLKCRSGGVGQALESHLLYKVPRLRLQLSEEEERSKKLG